MRRLLPLALCTTIGLALSPLLQAQGTREDYAVANGFRDMMRGKVFKGRIDVRWIGDRELFWYRVDVRGEREFLLVDAEKGERRTAFDHDRLATALSKALAKSVAAGRLPFGRIV